MVAIQNLSDEDKKSREALDALITTNAQSILQTQIKVQKELEAALKTLRVAHEKSSKSIEKVVLSSSKSKQSANNAPMIKSLQEVLLLQQNINKKLVELADSNSKLLKEVACLPDRFSILNKWWRLCQIIYLMTFQKILKPH